MTRAALSACLLAALILLSWEAVNAQSPPCKTTITGMTPAVGAVGKPAAKPERGAVAAAPRPVCTSFEMSKQSRQLCVAQKVTLPGKPAAVVSPKNQAQLLAAGTAACKLLGKDFVTASPDGLVWSITKTRCFNGATTVASGQPWSYLVCCPAGADAGLLLPTSLARGRQGGRNREGGRRNRQNERTGTNDLDDDK